MSMSPNLYPSYREKNLLETAGFIGELKSSAGLLNDVIKLRKRMQEEGYLYLPGLLDTKRVEAAKLSMLEKLMAEGMLDASQMLESGIAHPDAKNLTFRPDLANGDPAVSALLFDSEMMGFWKHFLGGEIRHLDYIWLRAKGPGVDTVTPPHCDTVFMNRGTPNLFTSWTPLCDVPPDLGGLMILVTVHGV